MNIRANDNFCICKPYKIESNNTNTLLITNNDTDCLGEIIDGANDEVFNQLGAIVIYNTDKAHRYTINGTEYIIVNESDIFGRIFKEDE